MAGRTTSWRKAITLSFVVHGGLLASLLLFLASAQSTTIPQPAPLAQGVTGDPLPLEPEGGGMLFVAPRRTGPKESRFHGPDFTAASSDFKPKIDPNVLPAVALQRRDALSQLLPPRKLPDLNATPLDAGFGQSGGSGVGSGQGTVGGQGTMGTETAATFFAVPMAAKRVVFVLDASASMGQSDAWNIARAELFAALEGMKADARCKVIVYAGTPRLLLPARTDWLDPAADRTAMLEAMKELAPEGRTEHGPALKMAITLRPDAIYFLTDADDLTQDHLRDIQRLNRDGIPIHAIELTQRHRGQAGMPMQVLARQWNGIFQAIDLASWKQRQP
ncbi:MAG: VWA domain-containing protein [Gemmataceae bacterium]|nr:VWA domain-containing protein [Gemmataceae bacterium]